MYWRKHYTIPTVGLSARERLSLVHVACWVTLHRQNLKLGTSKQSQLRELFCPNSGNLRKTRKVSLCCRKCNGPSRWLTEKMGPQSESQTLIDSLAIVIDSHFEELCMTLRGKPATCHCGNLPHASKVFLNDDRFFVNAIPDLWHIYRPSYKNGYSTNVTGKSSKVSAKKLFFFLLFTFWWINSHHKKQRTVFLFCFSKAFSQIALP